MQSDPRKDYDLAGLMAVTQTSLQDVYPVSVGGRSRLAEAGGEGDGPAPLPLERRSQQQAVRLPCIGATGSPSGSVIGHFET